MVDLVKDENSGSREINRKLQLMLEETLMKNVHLQEVIFFLLLHSKYNIFSNIKNYSTEFRDTFPRGRTIEQTC